MAQNISLWGADYSSVPSVKLPKTGGGTASFVDVSDTTAAASDVASGKYFYTAAGVRTAGTNSGGGGGSTTYYTGTFTGTTANSRLSISIPYSGSGYPVALVIYPKEGPYNANSGTFYNKVHRYAIMVFYLSKAEQTTAPTYTDSGSNNYGVVMSRYKSSSSSATSYSQGYSNTVNSFSSSTAATAATTCARFTSNTALSVYIIGTSGSNYGFAQNIEYRYHVIYSS